MFPLKILGASASGPHHCRSSFGVLDFSFLFAGTLCCYCYSHPSPSRHHDSVAVVVPSHPPLSLVLEVFGERCCCSSSVKVFGNRFASDDGRGDPPSIESADTVVVVEDVRVSPHSSTPHPSTLPPRRWMHAALTTTATTAQQQAIPRFFANGSQRQSRIEHSTVGDGTSGQSSDEGMHGGGGGACTVCVRCAEFKFKTETCFKNVSTTSHLKFIARDLTHSHTVHSCQEHVTHSKIAQIGNDGHQASRPRFWSRLLHQSLPPKVVAFHK